MSSGRRIVARFDVHQLVPAHMDRVYRGALLLSFGLSTSLVSLAQTELSDRPVAVSVSFAPVYSVAKQTYHTDRWLVYGGNATVAVSHFFGGVSYTRVPGQRGEDAVSLMGGVYVLGGEDGASFMGKRGGPTVLAASLTRQWVGSDDVVMVPAVSLSHRAAVTREMSIHPQATAAIGFGASRYNSGETTGVLSLGAAFLFNDAVAFTPGVSFTAPSSGNTNIVGFGLQLGVLTGSRR